MDVYGMGLVRRRRYRSRHREMCDLHNFEDGLS